MSTPTIPPRPSRSSAAGSDGPTAVKDSIPQVPPRPLRKIDPSPSRDMRSPFNEPPNPMHAVGKRRSVSSLVPDVPARPPSVSLPSVGQEGSEYASYDMLPAEAHGVRVSDDASSVQPPAQTRNVAANMPLHAPRASVPQSTAKSRISEVVRTDSSTAAAAGIGKAAPADDVHTTTADTSSPLSRVTTQNDDLMRVSSTEPHPLASKLSFNRSTPSLHPTTSRPGSIHDGSHEPGIPEIGMQVPLLWMAGDVQAPSPAPTQSQFAPGIGYFNDGSGRAHHRRKSSRKEFGPPGSYGMHGHGEEPHDQFEREWVKKHPDQAAIEGYNIHGPARPETALTSAELNRLVRQSNDNGMGTDADAIGTPGPDAAWEASQEYMYRVSSPSSSPLPLGERRKRGSSGNQPAVQSPLRKQSYPFNKGGSSEDAIVDDNSSVHVEPPERVVSKITGGGPVDDTMDLGPRGGNTEEEGGWYDERGYGTPILASDEILKRPSSAFMQPAVSPAEFHQDDYESDASHNDNSRRNSLRVPSRPSSRPNSMHGEHYHGGNLHRFMSHEEYHGSGIHTPLEEIEEYEPLIPEGEEDPKPKPKAVKKRPGLEHHHFPSQDVWEDTPMSLQYSTTVETPEPPRAPKVAQEEEVTTTSSTFETPEEEEQRRTQNPHDLYSDSKTLINKPHARALDEHRPGVQRFPSRDIWEDTPDSMMMVTTVNSPQMDELKSPPDDRPSTSSVDDSQEDSDTRATTGYSDGLRPSVPARPQRKSKLAEEVKPEDMAKDGEVERDIPLTKQISPDKSKPPSIPDRPKPTVPIRPARTSRGEESEARAIAGMGAAESQSAKSPPLPKVKPVVPARPAGEKIAALKSGFMNDLNNRLKLGPQGPLPKAKEVEPEMADEAEKAPLADARKGRAKGPARRKPAASPSAGATDGQPLSFSFSTLTTLWHIDETDELQVPSVVVTPPDVDLPALEKQLSANEAHNTEEPTLAEPMSPERAGSPPQASLEEKIKGAQQSIDALTAEEEEQVAESPDTATTANVEVKEVAPITAEVESAATAAAEEPVSATAPDTVKDVETA